FEPVLYMTFETLGISMTTNITAAVILSLMPVSSVICEFIFLRERINWQKGLFLTIGMIGAIYIALNTQSSGGKDTILGIIFILLAVIVGALFVTFSRKTSASFTAMEITYFSCLMGAVIFNGVNIVRHIMNGTITTYFMPYMNLDNIIGFVFLAIISTIIATGMNNFALARMQVSTMSAFTGLGTLVSVVIGVVFNNEELYSYHIIGISLILIRVIGIIWLTAGDNKKVTETGNIHKE
ncbi:MAG: DMT family transporter, partial [Clostridia bacterium]|nr:DMT family transporter [Clostridia bacterium]